MAPSSKIVSLSLKTVNMWPKHLPCCLVFFYKLLTLLHLAVTFWFLRLCRLFSSILHLSVQTISHHRISMFPLLHTTFCPPHFVSAKASEMPWQSNRILSLLPAIACGGRCFSEVIRRLISSFLSSSHFLSHLSSVIHKQWLFGDLLLV